MYNTYFYSKMEECDSGYTKSAQIAARTMSVKYVFITHISTLHISTLHISTPWYWTFSCVITVYPIYPIAPYAPAFLQSSRLNSSFLSFQQLDRSSKHYYLLVARCRKLTSLLGLPRKECHVYSCSLRS